MYDLRHSFISLMQEDGVPVADPSRRSRVRDPSSASAPFRVTPRLACKAGGSEATSKSHVRAGPRLSAPAQANRGAIVGPSRGNPCGMEPARSQKPLGAVRSLVGSNPTPSAKACSSRASAHVRSAERLAYPGAAYGRSVGGSPKWGKTPVSANQVIAAIVSPSSVSTISE
jgi:hypothetical protein